MQKPKQVSESLPLAAILALAGGFMDAYSYVGRGEVFANAQTGNILLLGVNLAEGNFPLALRYLCPVLAFALGIAAAEVVRHHLQKRELLHWRQAAVLLEAIILLGVSFLSGEVNLLANSLVSFACGIQVESFRKISGNGAATTMCIGNLRSATQALCDYHYTRERAMLEKGLMYLGVILCFALGAVVGNFCVKAWSLHSIAADILPLLIAFLVMFIDWEKEEREERNENSARH